jgi:hypothetical protein
MKWLEKETAKGVLKYRMPNIIEAYDLLEFSGVSEGVKSNLKLKRNIVENMGSLLDFSGLEGVSSFDDMLSELDLIHPVSEIADEIILKAFGAFGKKI